ncbi:MAG TPA: HAMP domain-containing sensor histidine kinase, partial [Mycobacteriales bacterium]|nr:HAMP domain-containing sensor histidine kinase [Mycobacteriales bacterium]
GISNRPLLSARDIARAGSRTILVTTQIVGVAGPVRLLAVPVRAQGMQLVVIVGVSLRNRAVALKDLRALMLLGGPVALLLASLLGYGVSALSLRSVEAMRRQATRLSVAEPSGRLPVPAAHDELRRLALTLNGVLDRNEAAFARERRFVADASHELRTPLTSIRGFAELFRQGAAGDADDVARMLRRIEDEAARMGLLVDDLLLLARLDQQRPLERAPVDLLTLVADAVQDARARDPGRPIDLELLPEGPAPAVVLGDDARLRQVLANLLSNTLRHTPPGAAVTVRVGVQDRDGVPRAVLEVADTGPGMTAEDAARVFERFYRVDTSRTRASGGVGLGLSIVAALVAAHGGRVSVDTAPGAGCLFRVELPLPDGGVGPAEAGR